DPALHGVRGRKRERVGCRQGLHHLPQVAGRGCRPQGEGSGAGKLMSFRSMAAVGRDAIAATEALIPPHVRRTPGIAVSGGEFGLAPNRVHLKLELMQHAGAFKTRGAFTNLLTRPVPPAGVVAASGGNHGVAVAYAARERRVPARIFLPAISSPA